MIDIRIFGVPKRIDNIKKMNETLGLPDDKIIIDTNYDGIIATAKRTWLLPSDSEYVMVLNDDLDLCDGFVEICNSIVRAMPDAIISLFPIQFLTRNGLRCSPPTISPYIATDKLSGVGIIMPTRYVASCIASWHDDAICDDTSIELWAKANNIPIITTIPATIQHIGDDSIFNPGRNIIRTVFFDRSPVANWDSKYVTSWTTLLR